ncbi:uncharacterized oxidoreductase TM_0325-like [Asterias amurensis]|uniref:uncharacterized oxidoreductase TM_0325-like n=1 Tax=Asterias amurensis TaxID=7602 RepID=UPI003AB2CC62
MASFNGKVALITGATCSIGGATARRLASMGCSLALTGKDQDELMELARQCQRLGLSDKKILLLAGDLTDDKNVEEVVKRTVDKFTRLDVLVNNLSWGGMHQDKTPGHLFDAMMQINVRAVFYLTKLSVKHLKQTKGCIINNYNDQSLTTSSEKLVYGMVRTTLDQFMRSLAHDLAKHEVRVNSVNPGMSTELDASHSFILPTIVKGNKDYPLSKHSKDKDVAAAIAFLASHDADMVTGQLMSIDGGRSIRPGTPMN